MAVPLTSYKTPGVYVQEIRKLPPSIAQVETAIPVFIGYTQKAERESPGDLEMAPTRIRSINEYERYFGTTLPQEMDLFLDTNSVTGRRTIKINLVEEVKYYMYYALQMFYANGGGECFIISVGDLDSNPNAQALKSGMELLREQTDPTLIVFPDAVSLENGPFKTLMLDGLKFCADPKFTNFFLIMDVKHKESILHTDGTIQNVDTDAGLFREEFAGSLDELKYGAAYYPYLLTSIPYETDPGLITISENTFDRETIDQQISRLEILKDNLPDGEEKDQVIAALELANKRKQAENTASQEKAKISTEEAKLSGLIEKQAILEDIISSMDRAVSEGKTIDEIKTIASDAALEADAAVKGAITGTDLSDADSAGAARDLITLAIEVVVEVGGNDLPTQIQKAKQDVANAKINATDEFQAAAELGVYTDATLDLLAAADNGLYNEILTELSTVKGSVIMPPSSAMAGAYARVDSTRGVFQSPANISLGGVVRPYRKISDAMQDSLNVDTRAGKSINAIRSFIGRGTLVWGARTLAGNDREWRYISVRRFFNMVEESVKRALFGFVFEPNNRNTWVSVRAAIEAFLETQWRAGALLGSTPEDAYFVRVGMPETFTEAEMLDGFMVVEIGMAVVRPAEFIVLKFMHKFELGQN